MDVEAKRLLLASPDRRLLRELSDVCGRAGYQVWQVAQPRCAAELVAQLPPDLLLLDAALPARERGELLRQCSARTAAPPYALMLVEKADPEELIALLESGVDDFLAKPVIFAELLTRLRSALDFRDSERLLLDAAAGDPVTGLPGRAALVQRLRRGAAGHGPRSGHTSLLMFDVDFFLAIERGCGAAGAEEVLRAVAAALLAQAGEKVKVYSLSGNRFAALLTGAGEEDAIAWAEMARQAIAGLETSIGTRTVRVTVSCGVSGFGGAAPDPELWLERAAEALELAKTSGRNCSMRWQQCPEKQDLEDVPAPVRLLQNAVARDVFSPCAVVVRKGDPLDHALSILERSRLPALPVIDSRGELVGILPRELAESASGGRPGQLVGEHLISEVLTFDEKTDFFTLVDHFAHHRQSIAIVLSDGAPTGILTAENVVRPVSDVMGDASAAERPLAAAVSGGARATNV
ncbi:MAG: diguanylate cyclase domain-containing protein [Planctomycetota bacterium]